MGPANPGGIPTFSMPTYLILSVCFSVMFAACYKIAAHRNCNLQCVNTWSYAGAAVTVLVSMVITGHFPLNTNAILLGAVSGISSYIATLAFFMHIKQGQLSTSWTIISLSLAFPVLASILIWHEHPTINQGVAMALIVAAFMLMGRKSVYAVRTGRLSYIYLMVAFVLSGLGGIYFKALTEMKLQPYIFMYMLALYSTGLILGLPFIVGNKAERNSADIQVGAFMGFAGAISSIFLLKALEGMQGIVAFPARSLGNLVLTALLSIVVWKERLSASQWVGMALSIAAIWLIV